MAKQTIPTSPNLLKGSIPPKRSLFKRFLRGLVYLSQVKSGDLGRVPSPHNPEIIGQSISPALCFFRENATKKLLNFLRKILESRAKNVVGSVLMHNFPTRLNAIQIGAIGWQVM